MYEDKDPIDLARLAAFMDGEGSIVLGSTPRPLRDLRLQLCNTDPRLIIWAKENFSGTVTTEEHSKVKANTRNIFRWHLSGPRAEMLLKAIYPYLILKREQAEVAIAYRSTVGSVGKRVSQEVKDQRKALTEKLTDLKHINYCVDTFGVAAYQPQARLSQ